MTFSNRLRFELEPNELWKALSQKRVAGETVLDLTESNPTAVGLAYPEDAIRDALAPAAALSYQPEPAGLESARCAVAQYYAERGCQVSPDDIVLTASTSEAYSFLFKLLCAPGDEVLVPRPSYPLLDVLAALDAVEPVPYPIDAGPPPELSPRCRGVATVHPNNPTGAYLRSEQADALVTLTARRDAALIVDEVFLDYPLDGTGSRASLAARRDGLVFVLSGLSKLAGLPQLKLSWLVLGGADARRAEARERLEHIADAYLSVATPVQLAAPTLLELAAPIHSAIRERVRLNLEVLERAASSLPEATIVRPQGGWYAPLRLPSVLDSESWASALLDEASVYVHPGSFFGFGQEGYLVVSLLSSPAVFEEGVQRVLRVASDRLDSSGA